MATNISSRGTLPLKLTELNEREVYELLAGCQKNVQLTVAGKSSVHDNNDRLWGADLALTPVSTTWKGYWHSAASDSKPWIGFKMSRSYKVAVVEVDDRKDCASCRSRWNNVEVLVGATPNINDRGVKSCGKKSYQGKLQYT